MKLIGTISEIKRSYIKYIYDNNLQNMENKEEFFLNEELKKNFKNRDVYKYKNILNDLIKLNNI